MVTVRLYRLPAGWWVLGVRGRSIQVDSPTRLQRISSPLAVSGKADVYEATVSWKVTQDRPGRDLVLGQGFLTGLGGKVSFRQPTGDAPGWVIFYEESAATGGGILQATAVRVRFAAASPAPRITAVTFTPRRAPWRVAGWSCPPGPARWRSPSTPPTPSGCAWCSRRREPARPRSAR